jgi:hypothetical protein
MHVPPWQDSNPLHEFPSLHELPFATAGCWQPACGSQVSVVHGLLSLQLSGVPAVQRPAWQVSAPLHRLPSLHELPFGCAVFTQLPALQTSAVQGLLSLQSVSTLHGVQPAIGVWMQPERALHVSVVQALPSLQLRGVPAVHVPD